MKFLCANDSITYVHTRRLRHSSCILLFLSLLSHSVNRKIKLKLNIFYFPPFKKRSRWCELCAHSTRSVCSMQSKLTAITSNNIFVDNIPNAIDLYKIITRFIHLLFVLINQLVIANLNIILFVLNSNFSTY